jgi:polyhydroxybutyrate depolymerase
MTKTRWFVRPLKIILWIVVGLVALAAILFGTYLAQLYRSNGKLSVDGETRRYLLYVPKSYDPSKAAPLVISLHGYAEWPAHQRDVSGWNKLADRYGFIVVYPLGTGFLRHWRASGTSESYKDVDFISALIDQIEANYNIDPTRIYANGLSNGGGMSFMLSCTLADRLAAVGSVSGAYLYPWSECQTDRAVPLIAFHGTGDPIVPFTGGPSKMFNYPFPDVPTWISQYVSHNGCTAAAQTIMQTAEVTGVEYSGCKQNGEVVFYTIAGGGHAWPGSSALMPVGLVGKTSQAIDATSLMWQFFTEHPFTK